MGHVSMRIRINRFFKMNIQNGDTNTEAISNTNINENVQEQKFNFHNSGSQTIIVNPKQDGHSDGNQSPKATFEISTAHAFTLLFGCIGLAVICFAFCIGASCLRRSKKTKKKKKESQMIISRTKREDRIIEMISSLKKEETPQPKKKNHICDLESDSDSDHDNDFDIGSMASSYYSTTNV